MLAVMWEVSGHKKAWLIPGGMTNHWVPSPWELPEGRKWLSVSPGRHYPVLQSAIGYIREMRSEGFFPGQGLEGPP